MANDSSRDWEIKGEDESFEIKLLQPRLVLLQEGLSQSIGYPTLPDKLVADMGMVVPNDW